MFHKLYLEAFSDSCNENEDTVAVTLETAIVLFVLEFIERPSNIQIHLVPVNCNSLTEPRIEIQKSCFHHTILNATEFTSELASNCSFPVIVSQNVVIAGLCSVCRAIVKYADESYKYLLGFKESCLLAPSESSPWTKFCEVDVVTCAKNVLIFHEQIKSSDGSGEYLLPEEFGNFESHMKQPVKAHNIRKMAIDIGKEMQGENRSKPNGSIPRKQKLSRKTVLAQTTNVEHTYVEGPQLSIADIILFPSFWIMKNLIEKHATQLIDVKLPLIHKWIKEITKHERIADCMKIISQPVEYSNCKINYILRDNDSFTLYKRESKRYKPKLRMFTREDAIEPSLNKISQLGCEISSIPQEINGDGDDHDWILPFDALPEGGNLPENRLQRKKDQLFSLAREIIKIAKDGDRIVDFCSGQGHLAIILAYKLPQCLIYMLDNKEEMVARAKQRVHRLNLTNIRYFQCNLDYFIGDFDIGTSLHACGIASDIVLMHCQQRNANFVCCPCCYGKVSPMPHISYPRSKFFRSNNITLDEYLCIAHCADQAHDIKDDRNNVEKSIQGYYCMDIIDSDRILYMQEFGYKTKLTRLYPEDCTPKNRLLVGMKINS